MASRVKRAHDGTIEILFLVEHLSIQQKAMSGSSACSAAERVRRWTVAVPIRCGPGAVVVQEPSADDDKADSGAPNGKAHALGGCGVNNFASQSTPMRVRNLKSAPLAKSRAARVSRATWLPTNPVHCVQSIIFLGFKLFKFRLEFV
jgi:hypothetical protein